MSQYIRSYIPGATYFFTLVAYERRKIFCERDFLQAFRHSIKRVQQQEPFEILAWVQLPDHLHCIWQIPDDEANYSRRWSKIKRFTTQACPQYQLPIEDLDYSKVKRKERGLWQRRFFEHQIRDEADFIRCIDYLHYNPVKHGLVSRVRDWPYSSFHKFVKEGIYPMDWGTYVVDYSEDFLRILE